MKFPELFQDWKKISEISAGDIIFREHDPADQFFVILSGEVQLTLHGEALTTEGEGGLIGEMTMIELAGNSTTATALTHVRLACLDREQLQRIIEDDSEFSLHVMEVLANRLRSVDQYIATHIGLRD